MMEKLLTVEEIADYLGVQLSAIYQWTYQGYIPHIKLGSFVRFRVSQVDKWLESKTNNGRSIWKVKVL
jgi:excisionase family DNA binding protein